MTKADIPFAALLDVDEANVGNALGRLRARKVDMAAVHEILTRAGRDAWWADRASDVRRLRPRLEANERAVADFLALGRRLLLPEPLAVAPFNVRGREVLAEALGLVEREHEAAREAREGMFPRQRKRTNPGKVWKRDAAAALAALRPAVGLEYRTALLDAVEAMARSARPAI